MFLLKQLLVTQGWMNIHAKPMKGCCILYGGHYMVLCNNFQNLFSVCLFFPTLITSFRFFILISVVYVRERGSVLMRVKEKEREREREHNQFICACTVLFWSYFSAFWNLWRSLSLSLSLSLSDSLSLSLSLSLFLSLSFFLCISLSCLLKLKGVFVCCQWIIPRHWCDLLVLTVFVIFA